MAMNTCWRCMKIPFQDEASLILARKPLTSPLKVPRFAFSTTAYCLYPQPNTKSKGGLQKSGPPKRGQKATYAPKNKRKGNEVKARPPAPGERKAMRKRVIVSNNNALEVEDIPELSAEITFTSDTQGAVVGLPCSVIDQLRALEAFQPRQNWGLFRQPSFLIRKETMDLANYFHNQESRVQSAEPPRLILVGARGSGKSVLILQAMAMAFLKKWIVISIPEGEALKIVNVWDMSNNLAAKDLTIGHTDYAPVTNTQPPLYFQKSYTAALLQRIALANPILGSLKITLPHSLPIPLPENTSLERLCAIGSAPDLAYPVFLALWEELTAPSRPPVLLTLDGLSRAMAESSYMSPSFKPIHALDLALISWFMDYLSGKRTMPNGGAVVAATSESNTFPNITLDFRLRQLEAQQSLGQDTVPTPSEELMQPFLRATNQPVASMPTANPFFQYDKRVLEVLAGINPSTFQSGDAVGQTTRSAPQIQRVSQIAREEARSLIEYWARSGMIRTQVNDQMVSQKWTLSGGGIVGELEKVCLSMRLN